MDLIHDFFKNPSCSTHKQYEALRAYLYERLSAKEVARRFDYSENSLYCFATALKKQILAGQAEEHFFATSAVGRPAKRQGDKTDQLIIALRKKYLSVPEIKAILDTQVQGIAETYIYKLLKSEGFARLPRRSKQGKVETQAHTIIQAPSASMLDDSNEMLNTNHVGLLCFIPYIIDSGMDKIIMQSEFPETKTIPKISAILSFIALKLSNVRRYTADDLWCMDRGCGLFAGLNVLPKTAWFSSYSHRVTREMNLGFLNNLYKLWRNAGLLSDTINLDFVSVPYWGDDSHLENNWSGTRHQALSSILAALAQDPDSGIITYGDTTVRHKNESDVAVEFLDFHKESGDNNLKYLVFDSKFTTYENLSKLDNQGVKFLTIRRRGKNVIDELGKVSESLCKKVRVKMAGGKTRLLQIIDQNLFLKGYNKIIRQVAITGHGRIKPALIITNDFDLAVDQIVRKYARRWLIEKSISEQTHFFHLNRVSSSMVIKVDFDLTMSILAHNLYRLLANDLDGYEHCTASTLYEKFINNSGIIERKNKNIVALMKKKRNLPGLLTAMKGFDMISVPWLNRHSLTIGAASYT